MGEHHHDHCEDTADQKTACEVRSAPPEENTGALVDRIHDADKDQNGDDLKNPVHSSDNAANGLAREASHVGKLVAAYNRAAARGKAVDIDEAHDLVLRLVTASAKTPVDALALLATAQTVLVALLAEAMPLQQGLDDLPLHCVERMLAKAIEALETSTGTSAGLFTGTSPLLN